MHIAFASSLLKKTEINSLGGGQVWSSNFLMEEIARGNTFDHFAVNGSLAVDNLIKLYPILDKGTDEYRKKELLPSDNIEKDVQKFSMAKYGNVLLQIKQKEDKYDLVIDSTGSNMFSMNWNFFHVPLIVIGHLPVSNRYVDFFRFNNLPNNVFFIFPTRYQYENATWVSNNQKFIISHGVDISKFSLNEKNNDNICWVGRINPSTPKGVSSAVDIATQLRKKINIFGSIEDSDYQLIVKNWKSNDLISFYECKSDKDIIYNAKLFLFPIQWEEPFGLVMIEAMACGTPVVAYARGSVPEVVKDGETGFIVNSSDADIRGDFIIKKTGIEGLCEAVNRIYAMPEDEYRQMRRNCRRHVEENFTVERMVDAYEKVYREILLKK